MKESKTNYFVYENSSSRVSGFFNIYQSRSGHVYIMMGNRVTQLSLKQINDLCIDVYSLKDFDYDSFLKAYEGEEDKNATSI